MAGLKASTKEKLVREKKKICFILLEEHKNFTWAIGPKAMLRFSIVDKHYQNHATALTTDRH